VQRFGTPEEIAHAVASLIDRRAGFITGQVLYVCGGMSVGLTG
jgi:NAD(P)-dependent dehydrogenase (short-subunit alcohol dehydrogenase family)